MENQDLIKRRDFFKILSTGTVLASTAVCAQKAQSIPSGIKSLLHASNENNAMTMREGKRGEKLSLLGYGGMRWPTKKDENKRGGSIDQEKMNELIDYALAHGVNYFDTAPVYHGGQSEGAMGLSLSRYPRERYYIATKLSSFNPNEWTLEAAKRMYQHSMEQLKVDYIDFYLLHSVGAGKDNFKKRFQDNGVIDFLLNERKEKRIRNLGFSFHGDRESFLYALDETNVDWDFVQIQLNYFDWIQDSDNRPSAQFMYNELAKRNIPVVVMEPLLGGRLAKLNDKILAELKKRDVAQSPASWAFRFVGSLPKVLVTLSGITYMEHLAEDVQIFSPLKPISSGEQTFLQETATAMMKYPTIPCTACKYCMPCPFGIDIPGNFAYFNKCIEAGSIPAGRQSENYTKARNSFLKKFSKSVPSKKQSINCTSCGHCVDLCPQHIKIPDQMKRINKLVEQLKNNTL